VERVGAEWLLQHTIFLQKELENIIEHYKI
jgi:hypothetical protein